MKSFTEQQLQLATQRVGLNPDIFQQIRSALNTEAETKPGFETAHIAYYLGALLIIGAMGWFITDGWNSLSGLTLFSIALVYALVFGTVGVRLYRHSATMIPGGLLATVAVCMTPLAVYGLERQFGWWPVDDPGSYARFHPTINGSWVLMEIATIAVAAIFLKFVRCTFMTAPAAYALWYLSMDASGLLFRNHWTFHQECWISVIFGLVMLAVGYFADGEAGKDFAFWFYLFGLIAFTGGLSLLGNGNQFGKAVYCLLHFTLIALSIVLQRRAFLVFGALGVFIYLSDEASTYFRNSVGFTVALTMIGILFIVAGIYFKRRESDLTQLLYPLIPERVRHRHPIQLA